MGRKDGLRCQTEPAGRSKPPHRSSVRGGLHYTPQATRPRYRLQEMQVTVIRCTGLYLRLLSWLVDMPTPALPDHPTHAAACFPCLQLQLLRDAWRDEDRARATVRCTRRTTTVENSGGRRGPSLSSCPALPGSACKSTPLPVRPARPHSAVMGNHAMWTPLPDPRMYDWWWRSRTSSGIVRAGSAWCSRCATSEVVGMGTGATRVVGLAVWGAGECQFQCGDGTQEC